MFCGHRLQRSPGKPVSAFSREPRGRNPHRERGRGAGDASPLRGPALGGRAPVRRRSGVCWGSPAGGCSGDWTQGHGQLCCGLRSTSWGCSFGTVAPNSRVLVAPNSRVLVAPNSRVIPATSPWAQRAAARGLAWPCSRSRWGLQPSTLSSGDRKSRRCVGKEVIWLSGMSWKDELKKAPWLSVLT